MPYMFKTLLALVVAFVGLASLETPAEASNALCLTRDYITATGKKKVRSKAAERTAIEGWERLARNRLGASSNVGFASSRSLSNGTLRCARNRGRYQCEARARACVFAEQRSGCKSYNGSVWTVAIDGNGSRDWCTYRGRSRSSFVPPPGPVSCPAGYNLQSRAGKDVCTYRR